VSASAEHGCLLVADISGYTDYVVASPLEEAEDVVADVTRTVVERLEAVVTVNKLEGDAAFGYALDGDIDATMLLDAIEECYFAFRGRLRGIEHAVSCTCPACARVTDLDLKFVVHHGRFVRRKGMRGEELTGHDVIVVHRLLKNTVAERFRLPAYALLTDACVEALGLDPGSLGLRRHVERYEDVGEVAGYVSDLEARWQLEQGKRRVRVEAEDASFAVAVDVPRRVELAWELLTSPQKRLLWQVEAIEQADLGGRRSSGTSSVCVDGRTKIYEEILDWRPFDYFTERISLAGGLKVVLTTVLEPGGDATRVVTRARREEGTRLAWLRAGRSLRRRLEARYARLAALAVTEIPEERRLPLAAV
jgi:class 3 adenylate cyclase